MDSFWLNPPQNNDPAAVTRLWDAVLAYMQSPGAVRRVQPLKRARIVKASGGMPEIVPAVWGLVPSWAAAAERRGVAERHALLDGDLAPNSSTLKELWDARKPTQRCLIPANGWTAATSYNRRAFAPDDASPVTFAGLQSVVHIQGREPVYTFGVFYRVMTLFPYDGSRVPIVIRPEDRSRWLSCTATEARQMLRPPGMKVVSRRLRDRGATERAIFGPDFDDRDDFAVP